MPPDPSLSDLLPRLVTPVPGPRSKRLARLLKRHEAPTVTFVSENTPVFWDRASGLNIWDADGNRFVDLVSAFGVASLGHANPAIAAAVRRQARRLPHAMGDVHPSVLKARLCRRLSELTFERWTGGKKKGQVLLGNSGFEAVEAALKTARLSTGKRGVIVFEGGYHGLGYGALEATSRADFREPFADQLGNFAAFVPFPRRRFPGRDEAEEARLLVEVEGRIGALIARGHFGAILVEPVQGRGGEIVPPPGFLPLLRRLCDHHRLLLIADEIYTGFWRTGRWFAVEHSGVVPDLVCLGKAVTGCLPLSACVGSVDVMRAWPENRGEALHTSTFLGNPAACAAALAALKEFERLGQSLGIEERGGGTPFPPHGDAARGAGGAGGPRARLHLRDRNERGCGHSTRGGLRPPACAGPDRVAQRPEGGGACARAPAGCAATAAAGMLCASCRRAR